MLIKMQVSEVTWKGREVMTNCELVANLETMYVISNLHPHWPKPSHMALT
jgi:hypothetical protein